MELPKRAGRQEDRPSVAPLPVATGEDTGSSQARLIRDLAVLSGLLTVLSALLGLIGMSLGITFLSSVYPGYRTIALSAALIWIITGAILAMSAARPLKGTAAHAVRAVLAAIVAVETIELPLSLLGTHNSVEIWLTGTGALILAPSSAPISPAASALIIPLAIALFFIVGIPVRSPGNRGIRNAAGITGSIVSLASFTFVLSYLFGDPLLYGTQVIPIAVLSALAAFFTGAGLVAAAGPDAIPLRYVTGNSTRALLFRTFLPLAIAIILVQQVFFFVLSSNSPGRNAILLAGILVLFALATAYAVSRVSGKMGTALDQAEKALLQKNEELSELNEELAAADEELRQNIAELTRGEQNLRESEARLSMAQEAAGAGTWDWDIKTGKLIWSHLLYDLFGLDPNRDPASFDVWNRILHPDDAAAANAQIECALKEHTPLNSEYRIVRPDGQVCWINALGEGIYRDDGTPVWMSGICINISRRRMAEEALRESEIRYRTVADFTLDWEFWFGPDGKLLYVSPSADEILGRSAGKFSEIEPFLCETVHPDDLPARLAHLKDELAGKGPSALEYRIVRPGGEVRWIHHVCRPIRDAEGRFLGTRGSNRDITERRQSMDALRQARDDLEKRVEERTAALKQAVAYHRSLIEASLDPLVTINPEGKISDVNAATVDVTGYTREELIGTDFSDYFTEPDKARAGYQMVFRDGFVRDYTLGMRHRDGRVIPVLYNATLFHDDSGKTAGVFAAARDISSLKKAEEAVRQAHSETRVERQRMYEVLETLPVYVCLLDKDYRMPFANRYFRDTFGYSLIRPCYSFLFDRDEPCENCDTYTVMKTRAPHHWYWTGPNGRDYDIYDFPFTDAEGSLQILEMGIDITEQKRAEEALRKANEALERRVAERTVELAGINQELRAANEELGVAHEELNRNINELRKSEGLLKQKATELTEALAEKEMLLSEIHHRVKNNLTAFISLLSLEGSYEETEAGNQLKKDLQNRARSMALIHETLYRTKKYSHVDMGIYLTTLVEQITTSYTTRRDVHVNVSADGVVLDLARATPCGLIINELVTNSFKYAFPPGFDCNAIRSEPCTISVSLQSVDDMYRLIVSDNGVGLPEGVRMASAKSLGLKLVNFLARHQLRAAILVDTSSGTSIEFQFKKDPAIA